MKRIILLLFLLPTLLLASPVDPNVAQQVAENFINAPEVNADGSINYAPRKQRRLVCATQEAMNNHQYYIFNSTDNDGYVIISADNVARPVLGFSDTGILKFDSMPENMRWWLSEYDREIKYAIEHGAEPSDETIIEWDNLLQSSRMQTATVIVSPLIQTEWSQSTYYNNLCPYDNTKQKRCVTGCVATAMAQIMKYWEFPQRGHGSHSYVHSTYGLQYADFEHTTYNWSSMPIDLGILSSSTSINAVATLMYHCGVAVDMDYGTSESVANSWSVPDALKTYFSYCDEARLCYKDFYEPSEWKSMIQRELLLGRPLYYAGHGNSGGHAFICDGYRSDDYFHFNWGWDEQDGYYSLSALKPSFLFLTTADYTSNQEAILCLYPKTDTTARFILEMENTINIRDSVPVGEPWYLMADISNVGKKNFSGYIYASVYNTTDLGGFYYRKNMVMTDSLYVDSLSGLGDYFYFELDSARNLTTDVYHVLMQYRDSISGMLMPIKNDFYSNLAEVVVYNPLEMDLTAHFAWKGSREHWGVGDSIRFITQINNNERRPFTGLLSIKLVNKVDSSIYQYFDNTDCSIDSIPAHGDAIISVDGKLTTIPGEYDVYLLYKNNESEDWKLVGCTNGFVNPMSLLVEPPVERNVYVILARRKVSANWYYLTSYNVGTTYTPHLEAVNSGTTDKTLVQNYG